MFDVEKAAVDSHTVQWFRVGIPSGERHAKSRPLPALTSCKIYQILLVFIEHLEFRDHIPG